MAAGEHRETHEQMFHRLQELICRNDHAQNPFNVFFATDELNRLLSMSFASQFSSFQGAGGTNIG